MKRQKLIIVFFIFLSTFFISCNIKLITSAVNFEDYCDGVKIIDDIYDLEKDKGYFYDPFNFNHTDFGKLILVSIDGHPDIKTVELVVQNDNKGAFVVVYYHNGKVDNYINSNFSLDKKYLLPNDDWRIVGEQDFDYYFENKENGIEFKLGITLENGQDVKIEITENNKNSKYYSFLAAIGAELSDVKRFPLIFLKQANFVPVEGTIASFKIDEKDMKLKKVPLKVESQNCYQTLYSLTPLPYFWNEERDIIISPENNVNELKYKKSNATYSFNKKKEIESISYKANDHTAVYKFYPPFPNIALLKSNIELNGKFCMGIDDNDGVIAGKYVVSSNNNDEIIIDIYPELCWQPMPGKDWVSSYHYHSILKLTETDELQIKSEWTVNK